MADYRQYQVPRGRQIPDQSQQSSPRRNQQDTFQQNGQANQQAAQGDQTSERFAQAQQSGQVRLGYGQMNQSDQEQSGSGQSYQSGRESQPSNVPQQRSAAQSTGFPQQRSAAQSAGFPQQRGVEQSSAQQQTNARPGQQRAVPYRAQPGAQSGGYSPASIPKQRGGKGGGGNGGNYQSYPQDSNGGKKKKGGPWRVVFWIALVVFIGSLIALGTIGFSYFQGQNTYKDVATIGFTPPEDIEGTNLADITVDWDALKAKNPDTVGWIYIPGTVVNYPIVHTTDNEKYLTTDFLGGQGWLATFGTIFLSAENTADFSDPNNIVYGHHMNDGSMFACLDTFRDAGEFNSHRTIYILTPQGNYKLTTFSIIVCDAYDPLAQPTFSSPEEMTQYMQDKIDRSLVTPDPNTITAADITKCFAFVTCDYTINDGRAVLFASVVESSSPQGAGVINPDDATVIDNAAKEIQ